MIRKLPEGEFGPNVAYREYSLLDNPRAKAARADILNITACKACTAIAALCEKAPQGSLRTLRGQVTGLSVVCKATDVQLTATLEHIHRAARVLDSYPAHLGKLLGFLNT